MPTKHQVVFDEKELLAAERSKITESHANAQTAIDFALKLFLLVVAIVTFLHSVAFERGFHPDWSISRYMGVAPWSAIVFAIVNIGIVVAVLRFAIDMKKTQKLSKIWFALILLMVASFLSLSFCPVGLFDAEWGNYGTVSMIHRYSSYVLFASMFGLVVDSLIEYKHKSTFFKIYAVLLIIYAILACIGYLLEPPFYMNYIYFYEAAYIVANLIFHIICSRQKAD